ncbi:hypothetical protein R1sor_024519 [Riccia sorocarpa]|uniref:Uncharacterized protein n=1 Tax=Riccia sorocarpa TaxID=122646 RepID=A0ABD3GRI3_9MARC
MTASKEWDTYKRGIADWKQREKRVDTRLAIEDNNFWDEIHGLLWLIHPIWKLSVKPKREKSVKRRALEEAESIRSSARLNVEGSLGPSNVAPGEDVERATNVRGRNVVDEASEILKFAQSFAAEARAEAEKVLAEVRADAYNIMSSAQTEVAVITMGSSATADSKQQRRREWDANRKRM